MCALKVYINHSFYEIILWKIRKNFPKSWSLFHKKISKMVLLTYVFIYIYIYILVSLHVLRTCDEALFLILSLM